MGRGAQASFASIAIAACFFGSSSLHADTLPALAGGSGGCAVAGVRLSVIDAGATAIVEISAHLASMSKDATQRATCSVDWSLVMLSAPEGAASTPTIAIADSFVDHQRVLPVAFADGAGTATPHGFRGEVGAAGVTVALRLYVEGVDGGLTVELPRAALPKSTTEDAKLERRGKSARAVTAKFGVAGALALKAAPPGLSGGVGPTMPLSASTISLEIVPNGTPIEETIPPSLASLEALRGGLPQRLLDLSPQAADGFEAVARRAYAASLHADPIVAILGERILEWMAAGLPAQLPTKAIALPKSVAQAMGDVPLRLHRKLGEGGS